MNYIKQLNAFYELLPNNPLSSNAQCLYSFLLNKNSSLGWIKEFTIANMIVCGFTGLSRQALDRARNELKQKGYIKYSKGSSNQAGKYLIVSFVTQDDTQSNTQSDTQDNTQSGHNVSTLNKLNKTKDKKEKKERKSFDELIENYTKNKKLEQELKNHLAIRKRKGSLTNRSIEIGLENLSLLTKHIENEKARDNEKIEIVRKSIAGGWADFYPLKKEKNIKHEEKIPEDLEGLFDN